MKVIVVGLGHPLRSDDAVGLHCVWDLSRMDYPRDLLFVASHRNLLPLSLELVGVRALVLIDAIDWGGPPGAVLRWVETRSALAQRAASGCSETADLQLVNDVLRQNGHEIGWVAVYGVQPETTAPGEHLSETAGRAREFLVSQFRRDEPWRNLPELACCGWVYDRRWDGWREVAGSVSL